MLELILKSAYFMLPAYFANMAPVICKGIFSGLAIPIDFNKKLSGREIFGKNKTFRGLIFGLIFALIIAFTQKILSPIDFFKGISVINYNNWIFIGLLLGGGALFGDIAKSFIKRRIGIPSGTSWKFFDQIDFVVGALIFISPLITLNIQFILITLALSLVLNVLVNHISFYLKIRNEKW